MKAIHAAIRGVVIVTLSACSASTPDAQRAMGTGPTLPATTPDSTTSPTAPNDSSPCGNARGNLMRVLPAGATLAENGASLTIACDGDAHSLGIASLGEGIVRVRYGAGRASIVALAPVAAHALDVTRDGDAVVVCTPELLLRVAPGACDLTARDRATGVEIRGAGNRFARGRATPQHAKGKPALAERDAIVLEHAAALGERFFGLGLHAGTHVDGRGQVVELWNTDAFDSDAGGFPPDAPSLYESIPFYVALRDGTAYGVFTDLTQRTRFDVAATDASRVALTAWDVPDGSGADGETRPDAGLDEYLVAGPRMNDVTRRYTALTGRAPLPPPWALGFHMSRWEGGCASLPADRPFCSAQQLVAFADDVRQRGFPADALFLDIHHMNGFRSFTFDAERFADPAALARDLGARGFHVHAIVDPALKVDDAWATYRDALAGKHFLSDARGVPFVGQVWPGAASYPDFTRAATRTFWSDQVAGLAARGIEGAWIDMNEPSEFTAGTVPDTLVVDGDGRATTMAEAHNAYAYFEARATREGLIRGRPDARPFVLSRAAFAGQQKYAAVWTGDAPSTWATLGMTLPQLLALGVSGMPFAGSDVGGYSGREESSGELYARWMALGAVSPFFRTHAEENARRQEPWAFGADVEDATRALVEQRYALLPYVYNTFEEASRTGAPLLRPLAFAFQDDARLGDVSDEAMLGDALLVAPIVARGATARSVILPAIDEGAWFELGSGARFTAGTTASVSAGSDALPLDALPMFARAGSIVFGTTGPERSGGRNETGAHTADEARRGPLVLDVFPADTNTRAVLYEDDGASAPAFSRIAFARERTDAGVRLSATLREGAFDATRSSIVVRLRRIDHAPRAVRVDGQALAPSAWAWDENDRTLRVTLPYAAFALDVDYDRTLLAELEVNVPVRVVLPPGTPPGAVVYVASSSTGWMHLPLARVGNEAHGTVRVPRGGYASYKVSRGAWASVEKGAGCAERPNRVLFGAARGQIARVVAFAGSGC